MRSGVIPTRRWRRRRCVTADTRNLWGRIVFQKPANGRQSVEGRPRAAVRVSARVWLGHEPQVVEGDDETPCDAAIPHTTRGARTHRRLPSHRWRTGDVPHSRYAVRRVGILNGEGLVRLRRRVLSKGRLLVRGFAPGANDRTRARPR